MDAWGKGKNRTHRKKRKLDGFYQKPHQLLVLKNKHGEAKSISKEDHILINNNNGTDDISSAQSFLTTKSGLNQTAHSLEQNQHSKPLLNQSPAKLVTFITQKKLSSQFQITESHKSIINIPNTINSTSSFVVIKRKEVKNDSIPSLQKNLNEKSNSETTTTKEISNAKTTSLLVFDIEIKENSIKKLISNEFICDSVYCLFFHALTTQISSILKLFYLLDH